ncbi:hypothetical protein BDZ97DRAFT_1825778 [Flammula alnicola]|nr:hypothetical protein BDZ97DRAFT_1825778 [Flammula alnicola]
MSHSQFPNNQYVDTNFSGQKSAVQNGFQSQGFFQMAEQNRMQAEAAHARDMPHNHLLRDDILNLVGSASKQMLLASENPAFFQLFEENIRLKADLNAKAELLSHLKEKDKIPIINPPSSSTKPSQFTLVIPDSPPPCDRTDFPDVRFWNRKEWSAYIQKQQANGSLLKKLRFVTQEDGDMVSEERLSAMSKEAKSLWATLYLKRLDPNNWGIKTTMASDFFSNSMRIKFPEFRWCENDWKIEAFATIRYSEWKPIRDSGMLSRENPSINAHIKRKSGVDDGASKPRPAKKQKQARPAPEDIIELESDLEESNRKRPRAGPSKRPEVNATSSTPHQIAAVSSSQVDNSSSTPSSTTAVTPAPATSHPVEVQSTIIVSPASSSLIPLSPSSQAARSSETCISQPIPTLNDLSADLNNDNLAESGGASTLGNVTNTLASPEKQPEVAPASTVPTTRTRGHRNSNILSNLSIPKPAEDMLAPISNSGAASSTSEAVSNASKGRVAKSEKLLEANGSSSARNLYVIDYLKAHGPILLSAFKPIWDNIDRETLRDYQARALAIKKNAKSAANTSK